MRNSVAALLLLLSSGTSSASSPDEVALYADAREALHSAWTAPDVATAPNGFVAVWSDIRAGESDIYGALLDRAGEPIPGSERRLVRNATAPAVAWNGHAFILAFLEDCSKAKILQLNPDLSAESEPATVADFGNFCPGKFAIASNGRESAVVFATATGSEAMIVGLNGDVVATAMLPGRIYGVPVVSSNGSTFQLVIPEIRSPSLVGLRAIQLSATGAILRDLNLPGTAFGQAAIAYNGNEFLVATFDSTSVRTWILDHEGNLLRGDAPSLQLAPDKLVIDALDVGWNGNTFFALAELRAPDFNAQTNAFEFNEDATRIARSTVLSAHTMSSPVSIGNDAFGAAALFRGIPAGPTASGFSATTMGMRRGALGDAAPPQFRPSLKSFRGVTYAIWQQEASEPLYSSGGPLRVMIGRVDARGQVIRGTERTIGLADRSSPPHLEVDAKQFFAIWTTFNAVTIVRFRADGTIVDSEPRTLDAHRLDSRAVGEVTFSVGTETALLAWSEWNTGLVSRISGQIISTDDLSVKADVSVNVNTDRGTIPGAVRSASNGRVFLIVWEEQAAGCFTCGAPPPLNPPGALRARRISADGALLDSESILVTAERVNRRAIQATSNGRDFLVSSAELVGPPASATRLIVTRNMSAAPNTGAGVPSIVGDCTYTSLFSIEPIGSSYVASWIAASSANFQDFAIRFRALNADGSPASATSQLEPMQGNLAFSFASAALSESGKLLLSYTRTTAENASSIVPRAFVRPIALQPFIPGRRHATMQ